MNHRSQTMKLSILTPRLIIWCASSVTAIWQSLYSPAYGRSYLKLSTNDLLVIDYEETDFSYGESVTDIIEAPTTSNYTLAVANGELYAFFPNEDDGDLEIAILNETTSEWVTVQYQTTLTKNLQYYDQSSIMTALPSDGDSMEAIYIYGGLYNNSIANRLLEFNPDSNTLNSIMTSISPTSFYGGSTAILDSTGSSSLVIGGKASSGWVSMFQIAILEYKSWTFKTVESASFGVNSRINSLVLPVFNEDEEVESLIVLGGKLGVSTASPYVLSLNVTGTWEWSNLTSVGDFRIQETVGAFVLNKTLISVSSSGSKRSDGYTLKLYDVDSLKEVDELAYSVTVPRSTLSESDSTSLSSTTGSVFSSSKPSESVSSASKLSSSTVQSASASIYPTSTSAQVHHKSNNKTTMIVSVIIPVVAVAAIGLIIYFIMKKYKEREIALSHSDSESSSTADYYRELNNLDNQSISSWNQKKSDYEDRILTPKTQFVSPIAAPRRSSDLLELSPAKLKKNIKSIYRSPYPSNIRPTGPFADPEDFEDEAGAVHGYGSPITQQSNKSRNSLASAPGTTISTHSDEHIDYEEKRIEEMLQDRDVQVLVSSKRRSKLKITNPDIESTVTIPESSSSSRISSEGSNPSSSNSDLSNFNDEKIKLDSEDHETSGDHYQHIDNVEFIQNEEEGAYFSEVLKLFDRKD